MAVFDMITNPPAHLIPQADEINNQYFTVDTASMDTVHEWLDYNPYIVTYAMHKGRVIGSFNLMPLTMECGALFEKHEIIEGDLRPDHMLVQEAVPYAQYGYVAAIAVQKTDDYINKQCAAALMATMCDMLLNAYSHDHFRMLFVNPTTFFGNRLVRKLGIKKLPQERKVLKENDIYAAEMTDDTWANLAFMADRYRRFIGKNPWQKKSGAA